MTVITWDTDEQLNDCHVGYTFLFALLQLYFLINEKIEVILSSGYKLAAQTMRATWKNSTSNWKNMPYQMLISLRYHYQCC